ncbi:MAG: helix-hairpin-helix domain-containing protein [bacterium]|nr:helix-hairpin-helix domain-containing protein [bacterium]
MHELTANDQVNTFAMGNAFLKRAVDLGWIIGKKEKDVKCFFVTQKGRKELELFGIEVAEILKYKPIYEKIPENIKKPQIGEQIIDEKVHHLVVYMTPEEEKILRRYNISEAEFNVLTPAQIAFSTNNNITTERAEQLVSMAALKKLPGIGETMVSKLYLIGIRKPEDLKSTTPEELRNKLEQRLGAPISDHINVDLQKAIDSLHR